MPLHVFENAGHLIPINFVNQPKNFYESHAWTMGDINADELIGDVLYMHTTKSSKSDHRSGIIQHWYHDANGDVVFVYETDPSQFEGVAPPPKNVWTRNDWCKV